MISRWARPAELPALQALWTRCFGDGPAVSGAFWDRFPPEEHTRIVAGDGVEAMASWMPVSLAGEAGAYVYAVATAPEHRGRGLCRALMGELEAALAAEGITFAALCPAEASLYAFYAKMGYEAAFFRRTWQTPAGDREIALTPVEPDEYGALREQYLQAPHCVWKEAALAYLQATGTRFYQIPDGCAAVASLPDGKNRIVELLGPEENAAALCRSLGAASAEVSTPGMELAQGMAKPLRFGQKIPPAYLGFAFD